MFEKSILKVFKKFPQNFHEYLSTLRIGAYKSIQYKY